MKANNRGNMLKKMKWILTVICIVLLSGCMGSMNQYDKDAAVAFYNSQSQYLQAIAAQSKPTCKLTVPAATTLPAGFSLECNGSQSMPEQKQYVVQEGPGVILAKGASEAIKGIPLLGLGAWGFEKLAEVGKAGINQAGTNSTTVNNNASGKNSTVGNVNSSASVNGNGNYVGGQIRVDNSQRTTTTTTTDNHAVTGTTE